MSYRDMNSVDLVKEWRKRINQNAHLTRDAAFLKKFMEQEGAGPAQVMLGIIRAQAVGSSTYTMMQFLRASETWLEEDEFTAEVELAARLTHHYPAAYQIWRDLKDEELNASTNAQLEFAKHELAVWKDKIVG